MAQELHADEFENLTNRQKEAVQVDAKERCISYVFLCQSGKQHTNLKTDLQNDFTTGDNCHPKSRQSTLHLLDKYSKTIVNKPTESEGAVFVQKGGKHGNKDGPKKPFDKEYWKDKDCWNCGKKGHPSLHCKKPKADDDDKSLASATASIKKMTKEFKDMKKAFSTVNTQLQQLNEVSNLSDDSDSQEEDSHFQFEQGFQFAMTDQLDDQFELKIRSLFKQSEPKKIQVDLREVALLDSQSTMDLICNKKSVDKTFKSSSWMCLCSNGGSMLVTHKGKDVR